ncbi:L-idonate 5-dehydrogenase [Caballeronia mineralivorans]|jgi:L-idonate 5-dehydrogenase|uniref:L-idonate 5-dehydrogenase n=1 Tax=Caballeronia mineralivorans TaxID=2010198 RepID=UPI0023F4F07B|nr:L-idonate 5-dehydrogenase [Caballeronia mineralivorans]MDB5780540.1 gutB [Caballeronia mineralivorans]MEA3099949.1 L-idonate 5-dehydrogenase [Caballeronia mineralivorans]
MDARACVLHAEKDLRIEAYPVADMQENQVRVRIGAGGICGSDLHYYLHGGFGVVRVKQPIVLGHEVAGTVEAVGAKVTRVKPGERIALNPSRPCGHCKFCLAGEQQHCLDMWFYGSAMRVPHSQGAFRELIVVEEYQCEPVGTSVSLGEAACAEPFAVALHAVRQAGNLIGKRVLVTGSGPIGALVVAAARYAGALEVIATDLHEAALQKAVEMGATRTVNVSMEPGLKAEEFTRDKGYFDVAIECTGAAAVLKDVIPALRPRGTIVQVGVTGDVPIPIGILVGKEIRLQGAFRFHGEYALAARLIKEGRIDVKPIITATLPIERAVEAFEMAADRTTQTKVQLTF